MSKSKQEEFNLALERVALGEARGSGDAEEQRELKALAQSTRDILAELPVDSVVREVERRRQLAQRAEARPARGILYLGLAAAALAAALFFVVFQSDSKTDKGQVVATNDHGDPYASPGETRSKGDARLLVHLQAEGRSVQLRDGDEAKTDDLLQLSTLSAEERYGVIVSVDGRNTVTLHLPEEPGEAVLLTPGKRALPSSYQLDDAPDFERFYFVTASKPFSSALISEAAQSADDKLGLALGEGFAQTVFTLQKVQP